MRAWRVSELGEPRHVMSLDEVPVPQPNAGQLLVRVLGAAANFPDVLMCRGLYQVKPPLPFTPGVELCCFLHRLPDRLVRSAPSRAPAAGGDPARTRRCRRGRKCRGPARQGRWCPRHRRGRWTRKGKGGKDTRR